MCDNIVNPFYRHGMDKAYPDFYSNIQQKMANLAKYKYVVR